VTLTLYNTLTRRKEPFQPIDPANVRMYVCGPTVYDHAHIGNARPIIVFDVLFRLLRHIYGAQHVTYARNITDVDDKINARAAEEGIDIRALTERTTEQLHADIAALGVLPPTMEPRATEFIRRTDNVADMVGLIETLVQRGHAYVAEEHVLFNVGSMPDYGRLSNRSLEEMEAGARVEVAPYKKGPMDFVLWKPSKPGEPSWLSPMGIATPGRPGWHIECSAMAGALLGEVFDIHGGGIDLVFPHHENEIAQSRCAHGTPAMANVWMHNGFLQVEGEKMSKSLGNFVTINELLDTTNFGGHRWQGEVIRIAMLMTHYRQPINWTHQKLIEALGALQSFGVFAKGHESRNKSLLHPGFLTALQDDLNTPAALAELHGFLGEIRSHLVQDEGKDAMFDMLANSLALLGITKFFTTPEQEELETGAAPEKEKQIGALIAARNAARKAKDFKEADRIRNELDGMGIQLKDSKDPATGEIKTTWEVKR
jgi:cysteinyl-tRNA synthetase